MDRLDFAFQFREKFIDFANRFFETYDRYGRQGQIDQASYMWLTKNVNRMQADLGNNGKMHYVAAFQLYQISRYQIVINTIPKFRTGDIEAFDVNATDDCLLRYLGILERTVKKIERKIKNPVIWFREGMLLGLSIPIYLLNWFGILGDGAVAKVTQSLFFKLMAGVTGLVGFISGLVTIIQGMEQTVAYIKSILE